jgi:NTP pyrophosphatase (non-canonical NTP hydrolase)
VSERATSTPDLPSGLPREPRATQALAGFTQLLRATLDAPKNAQKGGWQQCDPRWLLSRLMEEGREIRRALEDSLPPQAIARECADVALFALMLADVVGGLPVGSATAAGECSECERWQARVKEVERRARFATLVLMDGRACIDDAAEAVLGTATVELVRERERTKGEPTT